MKLLFIFGTRPEAIKLAPLILKAKERGHEPIIVFTGQHPDMVAAICKTFGIEIHFSLDVMRKNQPLTELSSKILLNLDQILPSIQPDFVFVQGDTTSAFCGAYWAFCHKIKTVHVEAGLRTYDLSAPFPEEANRQMISRIASLHFAPTTLSMRALVHEGIEKEKIFQVGNTAIDALKIITTKIDQKQLSIEEQLSQDILDFIKNKKLISVTAHRRENIGERLESICDALLELLQRRPETCMVYPLHPNPNIQITVRKKLEGHPQVKLIQPLGYCAFIQLLKLSDLILTDSGGIQEEGPSLGKPILVLREETERTEGVDAGVSILVGADPRKILEESIKALQNEVKKDLISPYGDGNSALKILLVIESLKVPQ